MKLLEVWKSHSIKTNNNDTDMNKTYLSFLPKANIWRIHVGQIEADDKLQNANPNDAAAVKKAADEFKKLADIMHDLKENQPLEYISNVNYGNISGTP